MHISMENLRNIAAIFMVSIMIFLITLSFIGATIKQSEIDDQNSKKQKIVNLVGTIK